MVQLPNKCYCSDFNVFPNNWVSPKASLRKCWYISYRFYDPAYKSDPKFRKGKLVIIKGMNHFKTVPERQDETSRLIEQEKDKLINKAFNPIRNLFANALTNVSDITPDTPFLEALIVAESAIHLSKSTHRDIKSTIRYVTIAADQLGISKMPISLIGRKYLKMVLLQIQTNQKDNSPHRFNNIRSYLMILYKQLLEFEAVDSNPLKDIAKMKTTQRLRRVLSEEDRIRVNKYLKENHYRFWLFTHIFFHSGARLTELIKVRLEDVDLVNQRFMVTINKGQQYKEVLKPIKNIALFYWLEAVKLAHEGDYLFSKDLMPGDAPIQSYQITKRWNRHIKEKLGIKEDFYSLKHLNLDQIAGLLTLSDAAALASHTSTLVTGKHYAINEDKRQIERLIRIENKFE